VARVVLQHLSKSFQGPHGEKIRAVDNLSLCVEDGELLVLIGPSGCGKTTTLRLIAGLEELDSGTVTINGSVVDHVPPKDRDIAMVFQNHALYPHMSVYENMAFGLKLRKYAKPEIERRVQDAAKMLGLADCLTRKPEAISGGQCQRAALGRAIVRNPKVFLMDEPLSNLDAPMRLQMRTEIARLHNRLGSTMIYVTHDQTEAMTLGKRIAVMNQGVLQQLADPMTLYQKPANMFVAGFIGSPPMNFFTGTVVETGSQYAFKETNGKGDMPPNGVSVPLRESLADPLKRFIGKRIVLGIRPEHISEKRHNNSEISIKALTEATMPVGPETYVQASSAAHSFMARLPGQTALNTNGTTEFVFDLCFGHFFEPESQNRIN
jgi:multiple sugar transport system ATP-binding protein